MKSKCFNVVVLVAFLVTGLLVTGSALAQTEQDARDNAATSLHTTIYGMEIFYTTDGSHPDFIGPGYLDMTGVPYNTLPCAGCHAAANPPPYTDPDGCDKCHTNLVDFSDGDTMPDSTCAGCHGRQNKEAAKGFTDVHDAAYPNCVDCHTWNEMHGTGVAYDSMLAPGAMEVTCEGCHDGSEPGAPIVDVASHDPHAGKLHCSACHVKSVITCYNCHFDSQVDGVGKFANTALGANNKDTGFVMLMNSEGQVRTATFQSIVYDGGNEFAAFAPYHGHSVGTGADARTCDDCHANDAMEQLNSTGKIVLTSWNGSAIVQETTGAIPVVDGAIEMAWVDLISTGPNVWDYMSTGFGTTQYGYGTPLTESQLTALSILPPPPVRQELGFPDTEFSGLSEADCRACHDSGVADDHHMLYGSSMIGPGECSENTGLCDISGTDCLVDADCPAGEICVDQPEGACYINDDCATYTNLCTRGEPCGSCSVSATECGQDADCPAGETCVGACPTYRGVPGQCGQPVCAGGSMAPNNPNAGVYGCLTCHDEDNTGGVISFVVYRDCTFCHEYRGGANVHHLDSDFTGAKAGNCTICHGDIVDNPIGCSPNPAGNCSDNNKACETDADCTSPATCVPGTCDHEVDTYEPSLVTPEPAGGEAGTCNYCHDAGTDIETGIEVHDNHDTHHHTGFYYYADGSRESTWCNWCHLGGRPGNEPAGEEAYAIRTCENCHGKESLHNIQADSPNPANIGTIVVGAEDPWYGHIGIDDPAGASDCWGCHGFSIADQGSMTPGSGVPSIDSADPKSMTAGADTVVTVTGAAFSNATTLVVTLTEADGSVITLDPADVTDESLTVTVNAAAGNYTLQVVKDDEASGAIGVVVTPEVVIAEMDCSKCLGSMTITGTGFAEKPDGTDENISVTEGGRPLNVISWSDTEIKVSGARCRGEVVVESIFGSAAE